MVHNLCSAVEQDQYTTKTLVDNTIKINCYTPDTYRKLVRYMREKNFIHPRYQLKENRAFRIVINIYIFQLTYKKLNKSSIKKDTK
jgi:hypothetical protein